MGSYKIKDYDQPDKASAFRGKSCFYVIQPPRCISGYKLGKSSNCEARLKSYGITYGGDKKVEYIRIITFKKRDPNIYGGQPPETVFETLVKRRLKENNHNPIRGTEFYSNLNKINEAIDEVLEYFDRKYTPTKIRRSTRLMIDRPEVGDKVELYYDSNNYKGLYRGEIVERNHQTYTIYFPLSKTTTLTTLHPNRYRAKPTRDGEWTYSN